MLDQRLPIQFDAFLLLLANDASLGLHEVLDRMSSELQDLHGDFIDRYNVPFGVAEEIRRLMNRLDGACLDCTANGSFNHDLGSACEHDIYCIEDRSDNHKPALYESEEEDW